MKDPKISVITVVYNGVDHIEQCIQSVLNQNYENLEYIIIDGNSTDGTQEVIKKYELYLTYWVSEPDSGMYEAMNKGWRKASGDLIAILNSDDYYLDNTLATVANAFKATQSDVIHGNWVKLKTIGEKQYFREEKPKIEIMQKSMGVYHPTSFIKREVYQKMDGYKENYKLSSDYDFVLRIYNAGYKFQHIDQGLTVFRLTGVSNSNCISYKEGYQILLENNSEFADSLKYTYLKCRIKRFYKRIIEKVLTLLGFKQLLDKQIEKRWSN